MRRAVGVHGVVMLLVLLMVAALGGNLASAGEGFFVEEQVFSLRPKPESARPLGHIGPTGILAHVEKGVRVTIEEVREGSPAEGKFKNGEVITGVNGKSLKGVNPYVALGEAITAAEAGDGTMVFEVESEGGQRKVSLEIPVFGAYGDTWPLDCPKSAKVIEQAADYYHKSLTKDAGHGIGGALSCLFLLSTADDRHLPVVKEHYRKFVENPGGIGDHTWNNGYNGIACAEYYLRTGDKDMLPVLQAFCDDARDRQKFDSAWPHWGPKINPGYVWGGLMNPASTQVLTTLLLCKEAGADVDEKTLLNALTYFWRFVGRGTVPYGDHRGEGGIASNGKDAMIAAAMQVAMGASGDTSIYESARDYLSMATILGYPDMVMGHGDHGRGDGIWRGIVASYLMGKEPERYRAMMKRITWWFDLSRYDDGAMGMATCERFNDPGSGAAVALAYTAPLKTLRITGGPRSEYAKEFTLPARLWGTEADLAFHDIQPHPLHEKQGDPTFIYRIIDQLGSGYGKGSADLDPDSVPKEQLLRYLGHPFYMIRSEAAKALLAKGDLPELERLLQDSDPRIRRAALDGILDWNYFFARGKQALEPERFTPGMIAAITRMLKDSEESWYVVEGALFAVGCMPADVIQANLDSVLPWTKHADWWLRDASFMALQGLKKDPERYREVVPLLVEMMTSETHTMPRQSMNSRLSRSLREFGPDSGIGRLLSKGFGRAIANTEVRDGSRAREGKYNICHAIGQAAQMVPETAPQLAALLLERDLATLDDDELLDLVTGGRGFDGFLKVVGRLKGEDRQKLEDILYEGYRPELVRRLKASGGSNLRMIDSILAMLALRDDKAGWQVMGSSTPEERIWRFTSFDPIADKDILPKREGRRFREVELPEGMAGWYEPGFDADGWQSGKAPIGKGRHPKVGKPIPNRSGWGDGEFLLARTSFEVTDTGYDLYRLRILCGQGFIVYLNGQRIRTYTWWATPSEFAKWDIGAKEAAMLKKGTNTLAVYTMAQYPSAVRSHFKEKVYGQLDCYIEGLRKEDLY